MSAISDTTPVHELLSAPESTCESGRSRLEIAPEMAGPAGPRLLELILLALASGFIFVLIVSSVTGYLSLIDNFGDSGGYISAAKAIRNWDFHAADTKHFWGLPYLMATVSSVFHIEDKTALLGICWLGNLVTIALAFWLWGGWVAGFFAVLNFPWMQFSFLGGTEPLFMALLLGAFALMRRGHWSSATLAAALATTVRPVGLFALIAIGVALVWKRRWRTAALTTTIGLCVGILYVLPFTIQLGNPFVNFRAYQQNDWQGGRLLDWPFHAIIAGTSTAEPWTNLALSFLWIAFVLTGAVVVCRYGMLRIWWRNHPSEAIFAVAYFVFLYTYNSPQWSRTTFARFAIPLLPFVLLSLEKWIPKNRAVLWATAAVSTSLAACSALGIRNVYALLAKRMF